MTTNTKDIMAQKACEVMENAYAPYSNFHVGTCVLAEDGTMYTGCNVENAAYDPTNCAERTAIFSMIAAGRKKIASITVVGPGDAICIPCGVCRQVIREFAAPDAPIYLCNAKTRKIVETTNIAELLPNSFGPENLEGNV